ncbi:MAG: NAD(P)H-quinone oxidoreductase [Thermoanaerobaculia bacterium]
MKFLDVKEREGQYDATVAETAEPLPGPGEVLFQVAASGINRADLAQIAGRYPPPPGEPSILGLEISGTLENGDAVCALVAGGAHAERAAVPARQIFPAPRCLDLVSAAGIPEAFLTAYLNLVAEAGLRAGETLLVHAGASGVGLAAVALGKFLGARVAATTRTKEKLSALIAGGADLAVDTSSNDLVVEVEREWGAGSVDVILDPVGAKTLEADVRLLATGGRVVFIATLSGASAPLDLGALMGKRARLIGSMLRARPREEKAALVDRFQRDILPGFDAGRLSVTVDSIYPPARAAEAFTRMRQNRNTGKILIDWTRSDPVPA